MKAMESRGRLEKARGRTSISNIPLDPPLDQAQGLETVDMSTPDSASTTGSNLEIKKEQSLPQINVKLFPALRDYREFERYQTVIESYTKGLETVGYERSQIAIVLYQSVVNTRIGACVISMTKNPSNLQEVLQAIQKCDPMGQYLTTAEKFAN